MTSEQRPPVNNGHYFWVPRVVVIHRFDCISFRPFLLIGDFLNKHFFCQNGNPFMSISLFFRHYRRKFLSKNFMLYKTEWQKDSTHILRVFETEHFKTIWALKKVVCPVDPSTVVLNRNAATPLCSLKTVGVSPIPEIHVCFSSIFFYPFVPPKCSLKQSSAPRIKKKVGKHCPAPSISLSSFFMLFASLKFETNLWFFWKS